MPSSTRRRPQRGVGIVYGSDGVVVLVRQERADPRPPPGGRLDLHRAAEGTRSCHHAAQPEPGPVVGLLQAGPLEAATVVLNEYDHAIRAVHNSDPRRGRRRVLDCIRQRLLGDPERLMGHLRGKR